MHPKTRDIALFIVGAGLVGYGIDVSSNAMYCAGGAALCVSLFWS